MTVDDVARELPMGCTVGHWPYIGIPYFTKHTVTRSAYRKNGHGMIYLGISGVTDPVPHFHLKRLKL